MSRAVMKSRLWVTGFVVVLSGFAVGRTMMGCNIPFSMIDAASDWISCSSNVFRGWKALGFRNETGSVAGRCAELRAGGLSISSPSSAESPRPNPRVTVFEVASLTFAITPPCR